jgi:hypothetical protein
MKCPYCTDYINKDEMFCKACEMNIVNVLNEVIRNESLEVNSRRI